MKLETVSGADPIFATTACMNHSSSHDPSAWARASMLLMSTPCLRMIA